MALLARLALKNLEKRVASPSSFPPLWSKKFTERNLSNVQKQGWGSELLTGFSTTAGSGEEKSDTKEVAVESGKKSRLFPRRRRTRSLWRNDDRGFVPSLYEFFPSGLGNALIQASENINKLLHNLSPSQLLGRFKEKDDRYVLRFNVPGLAKEEVKITVEDGVLTIKGEHKEEEEEGSDDESWYSGSYGYHSTSLLLPEDAKVDEIKAEMKDGVLYITIPRTGEKKKYVKEISVH